MKYMVAKVLSSGGFWLLAHMLGQVLLQGVEVLALLLHSHPGQLSSPQVLSQSICRLQFFTLRQSSLLNKVLLFNKLLLSLDFLLKISPAPLPLLSIGFSCFFSGGLLFLSCPCCCPQLLLFG